MLFSKWLNILFIMLIVSLCIVSMTVAGDQDRKSGRNKDKSCQSGYNIQDEKDGLDLAALKIKDRKKAGSCRNIDALPSSV